MKEIMKPKSIEVMRKEHKEKILKNMGGGKFDKLDRLWWKLIKTNKKLDGI